MQQDANKSMFILNKFKEKNFMLAIKSLVQFLTKDLTIEL